MLTAPAAAAVGHPPAAYPPAGLACRAHPQWFSKIDADRSGQLDVIELQKALALGGGGGGVGNDIALT